MRFGRSRRLRSVPKNTGTTAQSLVEAVLGLPGSAAVGATERVVGREAPSLSLPLVMSSLLAPTLRGIAGGAGESTGAGGGEAAAAGGGGGEGAGCVDGEGAGCVDGGGAGCVDGEPAGGSGGATDRLRAKVFRLGSAPVGAGGGAAALLGDGATGRAIGADPTAGAASLASIGRL